MTYNPDKSRPPLAYTLVRETTKDLNERLEAIIARSSYINALGAMIALVEDAARCELAYCFHERAGDLCIVVTTDNQKPEYLGRILTEIETQCGHPLEFSQNKASSLANPPLYARANHPHGGPFSISIIDPDLAELPDQIKLAQVVA